MNVAPSDSIHRLDAGAALRSLDSSVSGLSTAEAASRSVEFGPNALARTRERSAVAHFLAQFTHFFAVILWVAAGLAALADIRRPGTGMATLAGAIVAVILTIIQVLAVDLGTDMLPALGLGAERPDEAAMLRPPRAKQDRLIDATLLVRAYVLLGVVESVAAMTAYTLVLRAGGWRWGQTLASSDPLYRRATTACLTAIVITQAANVFACRSETRHVAVKGIASNRLLVAGVLVELLLIASIDWTPWGHRVFRTATVGWTPWVATLPFATVLLVLDGLWKRRRGRYQS